MISICILTSKRKIGYVCVDDQGARRMSNPPPEDYRVGYGKPPLETRFKPGNAGGRRRRARSLTTRLCEALEQRVVVTTEGGRRRRIAKADLGIARLADEFAKGKTPATRLLLGLLLELERRLPPEPGVPPPSEEADRIVIESLRARLLSS
jgi:hypothetical protein